MSGKMSRDKGRNGEYEIVKILQQHGYDKAHRGKVFYGEDDIMDGPDKLHLEVKRQEKLNINSWWQQSVDATKDGEKPTVIFRRNREEWRILLKLGDFLELIKENK